MRPHLAPPPPPPGPAPRPTSWRRVPPEQHQQWHPRGHRGIDLPAEHSRVLELVDEQVQVKRPAGQLPDPRDPALDLRRRQAGPAQHAAAARRRHRGGQLRPRRHIEAHREDRTVDAQRVAQRRAHPPTDAILPAPQPAATPHRNSHSAQTGPPDPANQQHLPDPAATRLVWFGRPSRPPERPVRDQSP